MNTKDEEIEYVLKERKIDVAVITETKKKGSGTEELRDFVRIYGGVPKAGRARSGTMILVGKAHKDKISSYRIWTDRIVEATVNIKGNSITVVGVYAPEEGKEEESDEFYDSLQKVIQKKTGITYIIGDLNARTGRRGIKDITGPHGEDTVNRNGKRLIDFCSYNKYRIMNGYYKHKWQNTITWAARGSESVIDCIIGNSSAKETILNVKAYRGWNVGTDHRLVEAELRMKNGKTAVKKETKKERVLNINSLSDPTSRWLLQRRMEIIEEERPVSDDVDEEWDNIKHILRTAAEEALGWRNRVRNPKKIPIWNTEIAEAIKRKQSAWKKWVKSQKIEDKRQYAREIRTVKSMVRKIRRQSWENFVANLEYDTYKTRPNVYKIIKRIAADEVHKTKIAPPECEKIADYYEELWKDEEEREATEIQESPAGEFTEFTRKELEEALKKSKNAKAPGCDNIPTDIYKNATQKCKDRILKLFNNMAERKKIPEDFENAIVVPIHKKGDRNDPGNYRGISLLCAGYKLFAKMIARRIDTHMETRLLECQNGFRKGRSCIDGAFATKLLLEKRREYNLETHICFVDLEKAYDSVKRGRLFNILREEEIDEHLCQIIEEIYKRNRIQVRTEGESKPRRINRGVRQGCPLSCVLFNAYLNSMVRKWDERNPQGINIENDSIKTLLFADDQVVFAKSEDELQRLMFSLEKHTEDYELKISTEKTKVMAFKGREAVRSKIVVRNRAIEQVNTFKYLGCEISQQGEVDVDSKVEKFLKVTGALNRAMPAKSVRRETRIRAYNILARPVLLYGSEIWALRKDAKRRITAAEMKYMRATAGYTKMDKKRNSEILNELNVEPIMGRIKRYRKDWRSHVMRMSDDRSPRKIWNYTPKGRRSRGRPMKRILDTSSSGSQGSNSATGSPAYAN